MPETVVESGQGPEILGSRLTVYNLLESFLDPEMTETDICRVYQLTAKQVAAARAYVLRNAETVLEQHLKIEERLAAGNPPEVRERAKEAKATLSSFRRWLAEREAEKRGDEGQNGPRRLPTFKEWLAEHERR